MKPSVIVLGGGLAGIAAALRLVEHDIPVTLIETRKRLGGRATSFSDPQTSEHLDNCQHVVMGCCTNLLDLYRRMNADHHIQWHPQLLFADKQGRRADLHSTPLLPAPFHLSPSFNHFSILSRADRRAIARGLIAMIRLGRTGRLALADQSFSSYLASLNQPQTAIDRYWAVIAVSACNQTPQALSACSAIQVFQEGFLAHRRAWMLGTSAVPLESLYDPATAILSTAPSSLRLSTSVHHLNFAEGRIASVTIDSDQDLSADYYITTLPFDRLARVSPPELVACDPRLQHLDGFSVSPILGIHLWFDRPILDSSHLIFVDSPLQWLFTKSSSPSSTSHYYHAVISAAHALVNLPAEELTALALRELADYLPRVPRARLVRSRIIKEKRATFSPAPGIDAIRPQTRGPVPNLLLAGDWTATGWPATMEGAVRSGYAAASAVVGKDLLIPDLRPSLVYRALAPRD